jgi:undecaprenyl diphosphate synthase
MAKKTMAINHLAIIPDGNRRWAQRKRIFDEEKVYQKGMERIEETMEAVAEREIKFLTLWASSLINLKERTGKFREVMNRLYVREFNDLTKSQMVTEREVKIQVIGEWEDNLSKEAVEAIKNAVQTTAENEKRIFTILVGYDGKRECGAAALELINDITKNRLNPSQTIESAEVELKKRSWTKSLPKVDLLIRTGSWEDPHLSADFLTFLIGEAQLAFPQVFWPDFSREVLHKILSTYDKKERRFGK